MWTKVNEVNLVPVRNSGSPTQVSHFCFISDVLCRIKTSRFWGGSFWPVLIIGCFCHVDCDLSCIHCFLSFFSNKYVCEFSKVFHISLKFLFSHSPSIFVLWSEIPGLSPCEWYSIYSKILLLCIAQDQTGAKFVNILDNEIVPVLT